MLGKNGSPVKLIAVAAAIRQLTRWIERHGGTEAGYVAFYGSRDDREHYGEGGEEEYRRDCSELRRLKALHDALVRYGTDRARKRGLR